MLRFWPDFVLNSRAKSKLNILRSLQGYRLLYDVTNFRVVIPLCGGNIDTTVLGRCLDRGLAADGRLVKFSVTISDRPGGMAELTGYEHF